LTRRGRLAGGAAAGANARPPLASPAAAEAFRTTSITSTRAAQGEVFSLKPEGTDADISSMLRLAFVISAAGFAASFAALFAR
jgi:hypothetical protein